MIDIKSHEFTYLCSIHINAVNTGFVNTKYNIHIIKDKQHIIFNKHNGTHSTQWINHIDMLLFGYKYRPCTVYIPSKKSILLFGYSGKNILIYSLETKIWRKIENISLCGCNIDAILTMDEKHVVIISKRIEMEELSEENGEPCDETIDTIWILNIDESDKNEYVIIVELQNMKLIKRIVSNGIKSIIFLLYNILIYPYTNHLSVISPSVFIILLETSILGNLILHRQRKETFCDSNAANIE